MTASPSSPSAIQNPRRRIVVLGASNVTRSFSFVVAAIRQRWGGPLDILTALGHGRSYGIRSRVWVRELPGIESCGLWDALAARQRLPTAALLTDIGNDLLYGIEPARICEWIERCLDRLAAVDARVAITELPLGNLAHLTNCRFNVLRKINFPASRLSLADAISRASELNARLTDLCRTRGIALVAQQSVWYGIDPIHFKRRHWRSVWQEFLSPLSESASPCDALAVQELRALAVYLLRPDRRWILGREQRSPQPARRFSDGTTISIY